MSYLINESTIRNFVGGASFGGALICFFFSFIYDKSFGKLGSGGLLVYVGISLIIFYLIWGFRRIRVPERFQTVVETILCVAICFISVELDKLVPGKSDALGIISYGLFALMSASKSRKSELGFETGFCSFFLSLFLEQLFKTNWKLLPIGLVFGLATIFLRHRSHSGSPNGDRPQEVVPLINATAPAIDNHEYLDLEGQYPPMVGQDSGESLSSTNNQENNPNESSQVAHYSPSNNGEVLQESILEVVRDNQQNNDQEETRSSFPVTHHSSRISEGSTIDGGNEQNNEQEEEDSSSLPADISSRNNQNGWIHSPPPRPLPRIRRRRRWMTSGIQATLRHVGGTLGRGGDHVAPSSYSSLFLKCQPSTIWSFVGHVSFINGLVCFALSSTFNDSFGKLGFAW